MAPAAKGTSAAVSGNAVGRSRCTCWQDNKLTAVLAKAEGKVVKLSRRIETLELRFQYDGALESRRAVPEWYRPEITDGTFNNCLTGMFIPINCDNMQLISRI